MADTRYCCGGGKDMICIDTYRVLDSCRDKDCFEDVRVYLGGCGNDILGRAPNIRAKSAKVLWSCIDIDSVPFNRGFYQLLIRIYTKITCEACLSPGNVQEFEGVAAVEKKVILFGGEGNVSVFKSELEGLGCCSTQTSGANTLPVAVFEVVDPIVLDSKILNCNQPCQCCCSCEEIPDRVCACLSSPLCDPCGQNILTVSLGFFSVVRIERPAQYLVSAVEYNVPEKECATPAVEDACALFRQMSFPLAEFSSTGGAPMNPQVPSGGDCGCRS
ncbi:MAG: hypothetical protein J6Q17_02705 [Clostridia bacterium]|nr:hypothetical protein [Clostridia bacterium]